MQIVHDYLCYRQESVPLVTRTYSDRQKRNRAFAAEFLAPAELLRRRIGSTDIGTDQIADLADKFGVSTMVIEHQVRNHRLARVIED